MTWQLTGKGLELCSCKQFCPCWFGPGREPDEGWCAGIFGFDIRQGTSDGIDLAGTRAVVMGYWPGNFFEGEGTGRVFVDDSASEDQHSELDAIFGGRKEGLFSDLWGAVIDEWLPTREGGIAIDWDGDPSITVDGLGQARLEPLTDGAGKPTIISGTAGQAGLQIESMQIADAREARWDDTDIRGWRAADGVVFEFDWRD